MISCEQYDYVEIACLYQYPLKLEMKDGSCVLGKAKDTKRNAQGQECLVLTVGEDSQLLVLDELAEMTVQIENPHFDSVSF